MTVKDALRYARCSIGATNVKLLDSVRMRNGILIILTEDRSPAATLGPDAIMVTRRLHVFQGDFEAPVMGHIVKSEIKRRK